MLGVPFSGEWLIFGVENVNMGENNYEKKMAKEASVVRGIVGVEMSLVGCGWQRCYLWHAILQINIFKNMCYCGAYLVLDIFILTVAVKAWSFSIWFSRSYFQANGRLSVITIGKVMYLLVIP
jgi:hypothetical protein